MLIKELDNCHPAFCTTSNAKGSVNAKTLANLIGEDVVLEDIQLVAYILLKQGVPLKQIVPSSYHSDWKPYAIEIGVDPLIDERPVLTYRKIRNFEHPRTTL